MEWLINRAIEDVPPSNPLISLRSDLELLSKPRGRISGYR